TVTDNFGTKASSYFEVSTIGVPTINPSMQCIAKQIDLRDENAAPLTPGGRNGMAIGSDGKGGGWQAKQGVDGRTLGRLVGRPNPANRPDLAYAGYSFEIVVDVDGNPASCTEIQLVRANFTSVQGAFTKEDCEKRPQAVFRAGICIYDTLWEGLMN